MFGLVAAVTLVAAAATSAGAATKHCRIEKPARPADGTWESGYGTIKISHLAAKDLPQHQTLGGSPCATANWLAYQYEEAVTNPEVQAENKGTPMALETYASNQSGREVPKLEWQIKETSSRELHGHRLSYTATFVHGRERVSLRAVQHLEG
jgi:hypothetical protein